MDDSRTLMAARNNAEWCDQVSYPDAVTLTGKATSTRRVTENMPEHVRIRLLS